MKDGSLIFLNEKIKNSFKEDLNSKIIVKNIKTFTIPAE
jgi:hypothetical protein